MKPAFLLLPLTAALGVVASVGPTQAKSPIPEATPIGKAQNCVHLQDIRESRVLSDRVIDFHLRNGKVLRNTLPHSCPQLGFEQSFSYSTSLSKLCNVDIITVMIKGGGPSRGASCGLGMFQPVQLAKKPASKRY